MKETGDLKPFEPPRPETDPNYYALDPMDSRYFDPEVAQYFSDDTRVKYQATVEAALAHTLADFDLCPRGVAAEIEKSCRQVTAGAVYKEEAITKHDIDALRNVIKSGVSERAKPFVHMTATSYDIVSTASSLQYRDGTQRVVLPRLITLEETLIGLAEEYADTTQIGRTHGQHAVPITFGFAIGEYVSRLGQSIEAVHALSQELVGKFSGAVGAYNALSLFVDDPQAFEKRLMERLGLKPAEFSTQIAPPDPALRLLDELEIASAVMANLATDMRHLQRSEISEVRERFEKGQTGSSTMAHKRNPINFENVAGMHRQVVAQRLNAALNLESEHQRDLRDSAASRFYPLTFAVVAAQASRLERTMAKLEVDPEHMARNLEAAGQSVGAEPLYLILGRLGHSNGHTKAKELAMKAQDEDRPLSELVVTDSETAPYWKKLSSKEQAIIAEPHRNYTGLAAQKARQIARLWKKKLQKLT